MTIILFRYGWKKTLDHVKLKLHRSGSFYSLCPCTVPHDRLRPNGRIEAPCQSCAVSLLPAYMENFHTQAEEKISTHKFPQTDQHLAFRGPVGGVKNKNSIKFLFQNLLNLVLGKVKKFEGPSYHGSWVIAKMLRGGASEAPPWEIGLKLLKILWNPLKSLKIPANLPWGASAFLRLLRNRYS